LDARTQYPTSCPFFRVPLAQKSINAAAIFPLATIFKSRISMPIELFQASNHCENVLERRYEVEIDNIGGIKCHQSINIL
jgi:hypothetical protein